MTAQGCDLQNKISLLFLILNTYTLQTTAQSKTIDDDSLGTTVTTAFDAIQYIAAKAATCEDHVNSLASTVEANLATANTWTILEARETADKKLAYAALSAAATTYVQKQLSTLPKQIKVCQQQSETLNRRIGITTLAAELNSKPIGADTKLGIGNDSPSGGQKIDITTALAATAATACRIDSRGTVGDSKHKLGKAKQTKIALITEAILQQPNPATKPSVSCKAPTGGTSPQWTSSGNAIGCSATTQPGEMHIALSTSKLFNTLTVTTAKLSDDDTANCKGDADITKMSWPTDNHVKFVKCQAQAITATPVQSLKDMSLDTLRSATQLDAAVATVLGLTKEQRTDMDPHIKRLFGTDPAKFTEIFLTTPQKSSAKYEMPEESTTKAIGELAQEENYVTALVHLKKTTTKKSSPDHKQTNPKQVNLSAKTRTKMTVQAKSANLKKESA
uniref:Variant surface glycoprotein 1125.1241 n=1 Tax=Trypanosoma brucei TaxID=5691 RepID=A0A1J0R6I5_9TRYP|nr:variant surface glycoprotein 1125.1241 [Trypanosoma brucei]